MLRMRYILGMKNICAGVILNRKKCLNRDINDWDKSIWREIMDYEKEFQMKDSKYRSSTLTNGLGRSGQRALLYATGMDEEDMKKPFVAVIGSFSEMVPGHVHLRELAEYVKCYCRLLLSKTSRQLLSGNGRIYCPPGSFRRTAFFRLLCIKKIHIPILTLPHGHRSASALTGFHTAAGWYRLCRSFWRSLPYTDGSHRWLLP